MAVNEIWRSTSQSGMEEDITVLYYDDVNETILISCTQGGVLGTPADGHGILSLWDNTGAAPTEIAEVNTDQFNDGQQHILVGPGAIGTDTSNIPLPTRKIRTATVAQVIPVKGQVNSAFVDLSWSP